MQPVSSTRRFLAAAIAAALLPAVVQADPTNAELLQKIEELSQKVLVLERKLEVQDEADQDGGGVHAGGQGEPARLQHRVGRQQEPAQAARRAARRRPLLRKRRPRGPEGHVAGHARAPDRRGHARRHLRFPLHAGLRPGPHRHPGRLRHGALQARVPGHGRQVQGAGRPRAAAVRQRHPLGRARLPDPARAEPRHRPAGRGRPARRSAELPGRLPERLERRRQQRDIRRRRPERRQGVCGARLRAPVRRQRKLRAARTRRRHRRHLHVADRHDGAAAAARPTARRHSRRSSATAPARPRRSPTANARALAPQLYYYVGRFGLLGEYTTVSQDVSRDHDRRATRRTRWTRRPGSSRPPGS